MGQYVLFLLTSLLEKAIKVGYVCAVHSTVPWAVRVNFVGKCNKNGQIVWIIKDLNKINVYSKL